MNPTETYPHRVISTAGVLRDCRCLAVAPILRPSRREGDLWGYNCPLALREALDSARSTARRYATHLDDIRRDILDTGHPLGDDSDQELTPRRLVREVLARVAALEAVVKAARVVREDIRAIHEDDPDTGLCPICGTAEHEIGCTVPQLDDAIATLGGAR